MEHKRALLGNSKGVAEAKLESMLSLPGQGPRLLDELEELVMEEALAGVPPRPGSGELAGGARPRGGPGGARVELVARLRGANARRCRGYRPRASRVLVTADDVEHPKPAPDIYLAAVRAPRRRPGALGRARGLAAGHQLGPGSGAVRDRRALLRGPDTRGRVADGSLARRSPREPRPSAWTPQAENLGADGATPRRRLGIHDDRRRGRRGHRPGGGRGRRPRRAGPSTRSRGGARAA